MTQTEEYARARQRAEAKYGFYVHLVVYAAAMSLLLVIDLLTSSGTIWFHWPLMGWGIAIVLHGAGIFLLKDKRTIVDVMTERELRKSGVQNANDNR
ncbi:2TM domain-containing protein [Aliiroseovarius sp. S253]|uniref:2TM domain-containing protein n=1 Tax=Aliiroseovarius sp. S253 TaxID=3415133 RepID=UPI003C7C0450